MAHPARSNPPEDNQISTGVVGRYTSITIGTDGRGLISYYDAGELMVAHCEDTACISATNNTLDILWEEVYDLGGTSIAIGADGLGLISYTNSFDFFGEETGYNLMVAHCDDTDCTSATTKTLFFSSSEYILSIGAPSITIGSDGLGLISYIVSNHDTFQSSLQVTHCNNTECTSIQSNSRCQMLHRVSRDATVGERVELWEGWHPWFRRSMASS